MNVDFTDEEIKNAIIVKLYQLQSELVMPEHGVKLPVLTAALGWEIDSVREYFESMKKEGIINWRFQPSDGQFFLNLTEKAINFLDERNRMTINETTNLVLEKSYVFYTRYNYDS
jgi:hypothetical protein